MSPSLACRSTFGMGQNHRRLGFAFGTKQFLVSIFSFATIILLSFNFPSTLAAKEVSCHDCVGDVSKFTKFIEKIYDC